MRELEESEIEELDCEYCLHKKKKRALGQRLLCPYENCPFMKEILGKESEVCCMRSGAITRRRR